MTIKGKMIISVNPIRFENEWESTGKMIKESPTTFIQTYMPKDNRFGCNFKMIGIEDNNILGRIIKLEEV